MKPIIALGLIITLFVSCKETKQPIDIVAEKTEVLSTMKSYKEALQNLTTDGTFELFTDNAKVFEQGKAEGTYQNYINHHFSFLIMRLRLL
jgi:lipopolysaccharide export system protein LptA